MLLALAQINPTVADIAGNRAKIAEYLRRAADAGADVVIFPELAVTGYPPRDWLLKPRFVQDAVAALHAIAAAAPPGITALIGFPEPNPNPRGRPIYNAVARCRDGRVLDVFRKSLLPTYDVFDESRYFEPAEPAGLCELADHRVARPPRPGDDAPACAGRGRPGYTAAASTEARATGSALHGIGARTAICICEDLWNDADFVRRPLYPANPIEQFAAAGADLLINPSASPFVVDKQAFRERLFGGQAAKHRLPIVVVNQVGGNDELVFDGASCVFDSAGRLVARARAFEEDLLLVDLNAVCAGRDDSAAGRGADFGAGDARDPGSTLGANSRDIRAAAGAARPAGRIEPYPDATGSILDALVLGTRDYVRKCGFREVVLGLSGGIDSAVTAAVAVAALGPAAVAGVAMPSRYSSDHSLADARELADNLGIRFEVAPIEAVHAAAETSLRPLFAGRAVDAAEENVQARIRGMILMAISNKHGRLLLTTGNKSEIAVGYCTLYGDMCGGLAVISDVPKTTVYEIGRLINRRAGRELIPRRTFDKPPSAELRPNQTDQDSLPPYDLLDEVLRRYVELEQSPDEIAAAGHDAGTVARIVRMVDRNEYKRRQAAPGIKVTSRAFGVGRRMPIAIGPQ